MGEVVILQFTFCVFRELAFQISEQFEALGSSIGVKCGEYFYSDTCNDM